MEYPYIGRNHPKTQTVIIYSDGSVYHVAGEFKGGRATAYNTEDVSNITREYLEGKCVKIESPEHSEFVRVLCEVNDIDIANGHLNCVFAVFYDGAMFFCNKLPSENFKQITIPLPPKAKSEHEEWPVIGDEVAFKTNPSNDATIIATVKYIGDKFTILKSKSGREFSRRNSKLILSKPKTEAEILRDELGSILDSYILGDEPKSYYIEKIIKLF